jgi:Yip1-like protein
MESAQQSPQLADLVTILYRPRETMRRILDSGRDPWGVAVVVLAFVAASTNDIDAARLGEVMPGLKVLPLIAIVALSIVVGAATWVIALFIISWIATPIGRMLGGEAKARDVRAALGWGMTPIVWSPIYRIPVAIVVSRFPVVPEINVRKTLIDFLSRGGFSFVILFLGLQFLFALSSLALGSFTLAEAQRFSTQKGFVNLAISLALPLLVFFAAMFTFRR